MFGDQEIVALPGVAGVMVSVGAPETWIAVGKAQKPPVRVKIQIAPVDPLSPALPVTAVFPSGEIATVATKAFIFGVFLPPLLMGAALTLMPMLMNKAAPKVFGRVAIIAHRTKRAPQGGVVK